MVYIKIFQRGHIFDDFATPIYRLYNTYNLQMNDKDLKLITSSFIADLLTLSSLN